MNVLADPRYLFIFHKIHDQHIDYIETRVEMISYMHTFHKFQSRVKLNQVFKCYLFKNNTFTATQCTLVVICVRAGF